MDRREDRGEEWDIPNCEAPLQQGDIVLSREVSKGLVRRICVVLTADCDIWNRKFGQDVACLSVIPLRVYFKEVWADRRLLKLCASEAERIKTQLSKWNQKRLGVQSNMTVEAAVSWVQRATPEEICNDLRIPDSDRSTMMSSITRARAVLQEQKACDDKFSALARCRTAIDNKDIATCRRAVAQQAAGDALPDDVFLLPSLPQLDIGPTVILLREVMAVPSASLVFRATDVRSENHFLRLGRLKPTYKYAVTQAFGVLYSRIGLSAYHEQRCKDAHESVASGLVTT